MAERLEQPDEQDQSEVFDETHLDDEGDGDQTLDEMDDVLDVTQMDGDADEDELEVDEALSLEGIDARADSLIDNEDRRLTELDSESDDPASGDEIELVYSGLMRNAKGAQASTAHWEARNLADDDIEALGYAPDPDSQTPDKRKEIR